MFSWARFWLHTLYEIKIMKLSEVHQIEVSSKCNLSCVYCVHHKVMTRKKEHMELHVFQKTLDLCRYLWRCQTQKEIWLHGLGESLLHPEFTKYCEYARKALPGLAIRVSTNGELLTQEHVDCMADLGIRLHISIHNPGKLGNTPMIASKAGILEYMASNPVIEPNNWGGQIDWPVYNSPYKCGWLVNGWSIVLANGDITTCCFDATGEGVVGNINQPIAELVELEIKPWRVCKTCNLISELE